MRHARLQIIAKVLQPLGRIDLADEDRVDLDIQLGKNQKALQKDNKYTALNRERK
jgi:hypothetical protein